jgi:Domain of unknown function (DUF4440)
MKDLINAEQTLLFELNQGYVRSAQNADVAWYANHLDSDFLASNPDGNLVNRETFLSQMATPAKSTGMKAVNVQIRFIGDLAIIHAGFESITANGLPRNGCYTDIWSNQSGSWLCKAAHFALFSIPGPIKIVALDLEASSSAEASTLTALNQGYIDAFRDSNTEWFKNNLDEDFVNSNPDGSLSARNDFIARVGTNTIPQDFSANSVVVRVFNECAIIHGRVSFMPSNEPRTNGRYTDVWVQRQQGWKCVSAHASLTNEVTI